MRKRDGSERSRWLGAGVVRQAGIEYLVLRAPLGENCGTLYFLYLDLSQWFVL